MWTRSLALGVLVCSAALGCGDGTDVGASPAGASGDDGAPWDATVTDADTTSDATTTGEAGAPLDAGATGKQCWPGYLNPPESDGAAKGWHVGRYLLRCTFAPDGGGPVESCVSNDPAMCPGPNAIGEPVLGCTESCGANEYALVVGGPPGTPPGPTVPSNCHSGSPTPAGAVFYCCPCEGPPDASASGACGDDAGVRTFDAACPTISASDYDQSCTSDSDCVEVGEGNVCGPGCAFACGGKAINRCALARYKADLDAVGGVASTPATCNCPADFGACCRAGRCVDDYCCLNACPDAGGGGPAAAGHVTARQLIGPPWSSARQRTESQGTDPSYVHPATCCPTWDTMYGCRFLNGGMGHGCCDPSGPGHCEVLHSGLAVAPVCGAGGDPIVTGRCNEP